MRFYSWSLVLILGPLLLQAVLYCLLGCSRLVPLGGALPWDISAPLVLALIFFLHYTMKRVTREEIAKIEAVVESGRATAAGDERIAGFFRYPLKALWLTLSLSVIPLLPPGLFCLRFSGVAPFLAVFLVPVAALIITAVIAFEAISRAVDKVCRLTSGFSSPDAITGRIRRGLLVKSALIQAGFSLCLMGAVGTAGGLRGDDGLKFFLSALVLGAIAVACARGASWVGERMGVELSRMADCFDRLLDAIDDKERDGPPRVASASRPVAEIGALWRETGEVTASLGEMRKLRKEAIAALVQNHKEKNLFLASMSHDLKSPLNSTIGFAELLLKGIEGELAEEQREDIQLIHDAGEELLGIINTVLDYSRLEAGSLEIHKEWTPTVELVSGAVRSYNPLLGGKAIVIHTEITPGLPPVFVDPQRISQVLACLLGNAIRFMEKGSVTVRASVARGLKGDDDKYLRIDVEDTGMGIMKADQERICESFRQLDSSLGRQSTGMGLGLSLSHALIDLHEGKIWVESEYGKGSLFSIGIPMEPVL